MVSATLLAELEEACPSGGVRGAEPSDAVDGHLPSFVTAPRTTAEVAAVMGVAARGCLAVVPRGRGTKLDFAAPPERVDVVVDLSALCEVLEHEPGDFVVRVGAGLPMADLARRLAGHGQRLPVDEVVPGSTVGGVIATGLSGPCRLLDGGVRDQLLGVTVVRADGVVARAGGKVVKNVAGYDLAKLLAGSLGTLAVVTEATLRLRPLPERRVILATRVEAGRLAPVLAGLNHAQVAASAVEIAAGTSGTVEVVVLLEGRAGGLAERAATTRALLPEPVEELVAPPSWWGRLPGAVTLRISVVLELVAAAVDELQHLAAASAPFSLLSGSAGTGVLFAGLDAACDPAALDRLLAGLRERFRPGGGSVVVLRGPAGIRRAVDRLGPVPGLELMERVKRRFDPLGVLSPGRFTGAW